MKGQKVAHARFGQGTVVDFEPPHIHVRFDNGETRMFLYPESAERFLRFEDAEAARRAECDLEKAKQAAVMASAARAEACRRAGEAVAQRHREELKQRKSSVARNSAARASQSAKTASNRTVKK